MKLRNKKTGEIGEIGYLAIENNINDQEELFNYNSLAELNEEWEDYEETPKEWWYLGNTGLPIKMFESVIFDQDRFKKGLEEIGNHFESKEQAEKAAEKLKIWKRLKDRGAKIVGWSNSWNLDLNGCGFNDDDIIVGIKLPIDYSDDENLDLLFGEEE